MKLEVFRLDFGHIACKNSILISGGDPDKTTVIGCFGYLIRRGGEYMLIDCGIESLETVNRTKSSKDDWQRNENEGTLPENLARLGVKPQQISKVFLTHSHYDHISGLIYLENATVCMSCQEYDYLMSGQNPHCPVLSDQIATLRRKEQEGRLILVKDRSSQDGVRCQVVGGHTPGSMMISLGNFLFTGDAVFLLESLEKNAPIGFSTEPEAAKRAVALCTAHKGAVLTGHDLLCPKQATSEDILGGESYV